MNKKWVAGRGKNERRNGSPYNKLDLFSHKATLPSIVDVEGLSSL
jgi:hypothetical protein